MKAQEFLTEADENKNISSQVFLNFIVCSIGVLLLVCILFWVDVFYPSKTFENNIEKYPYACCAVMFMLFVLIMIITHFVRLNTMNTLAMKQYLKNLLEETQEDMLEISKAYVENEDTQYNGEYEKDIIDVAKKLACIKIALETLEK